MSAQPLLKLEINARTANDGAFSASQFNQTNRRLTIGVGEIFNLEVLYRDLRTSASRIGASAIYADLLYESANANKLLPVLTETQFLELSANVIDASAGTFDFTYPNTTSVVSVPFDDFALNQAGSIQAAIQSLGYANVSVQALARNSPDPFRYLIRYNDFALADQDLPNLIVTPRLDLTVTSAVTDEKPRHQDGSLNSRALPLNINFRSRTLPASAGNTFFGFAGTQVGSFTAATGFSDVGAAGPLLTTGWPQLNTGTPLPNPFDAFSIPVRMTENVTDMRLVIDPPNTAATANRLYGRDEPIPSSLIVVDTATSPATAAGATGVIFITATGGEAIAVSAADSSVNAVTNGPAVPIDLRPLVTVVGTTKLPTITIKTPPTKGTLSVVNGVHQYTPNPGAGGPDSFVYTATVDGVSDDGTISVSIAAGQIQLTAENGSLTTFENGLSVAIDLATLVTTIPASTPLTYSIVGNPSLGQVGLASNSLANYTPPSGQSGRTSFRYRVTSVNDPNLFREGVIDVIVNQEITSPVNETVITVPAGQSVTDSTVLSGDTVLVKRGPGTLVLTLAHTHAGGLVVEEGEVMIRNTAALNGGPLDVRSRARLALDTGIGRMRVSALSLDASGLLDVGRAGIVIAAGGYDASLIRQTISAGRNGGSWIAAAGITSSAAASSAGRAVGYAPGSGGSMVVAFAAPGDTNLDNQVNIVDLVAIQSSGVFGTGAAAAWVQGDSNYDGVFSVVDMVAIQSSGVFGTGNYNPAPVVQSTGHAVSPSGLTAGNSQRPSIFRLVAFASLAGEPAASDMVSKAAKRAFVSL